MHVDIRILGPTDRDALARVAPGVFDHSIDQRLATEFLHDPRHHLVVGLDAGEVVGFASAVHYVHPDKPPELWINEVGVAPTHEGSGIGKRLLDALFAIARGLKCREAWVLTDQSNERALRLYNTVGGERSEQVMFSFHLSD
jgi:ribosomal protein S18 acetylase RimI-like enzyme